MKMIKHLMPLIVLCFFVFAKQSDYKVKQEITIQTLNEQRPVVIESSNIIIVDDSPDESIKFEIKNLKDVKYI